MCISKQNVSDFCGTKSVVEETHHRLCFQCPFCEDDAVLQSSSNLFVMGKMLKKFNFGCTTDLISVQLLEKSGKLVDVRLVKIYHIAIIITNAFGKIIKAT